MAELNSLKVLIVDDDLNIRKIIKSVAASLGVKEISEAINGQEAFDLLKVPPTLTSGSGRRKYNLVICDWQMPVMTGVELLEKIRKDSFLKSTNFVMVTAEDERDNIVRAVESGVDDYVVKPFTGKILEETILRVAKKIK